MDLGIINENSATPKFQQIAYRIIELIQNKTLTLGDKVPSINEIIKRFSVSRDTAVKAYSELKRLGIIEAKPNKAYFVANDYVDYKKKILFLSDHFTPYKEKIYFGILDNLEKDYYVDILTHYDSFDILRFVYEKARSQGIYEYILIIPTAAQNYEAEYFKYVNANNIIFVDRRVPGINFPTVYQDFKHGFYTALKQEKMRFKDYNRLVFFTKHYTDLIVEEMKEGLKKFAREEKIPFEHRLTLFSERDIAGKVIPEKGAVHIMLDDLLLAESLKQAAIERLTPGKDFGLIAVNDHPFFEYIAGGITRLTTDFYAMGCQAVHIMKNKQPESCRIPTTLQIRSTFY
ncbi:MAG: GntR family transcriptional regulator [Spirochaetales bacterium]|nr:GntR family transcriptional regulator [Spirochaetales bacterium]